MKKCAVLICLTFITLHSISKDSLAVKKNFIGSDINFFEFGFFYFITGNFDIRYIRTFHKRFDLNTTLGMTYPYITGYADDNFKAKDVILGKFTIVPTYTPLRRKNKTLQLGVGYATEFQKQFSLNGVTVQMNFLKNSKKRNFTYGFNFYNDLLFYHKQSFPNYKLGLGFFIGGRF